MARQHRVDSCVKLFAGHRFHLILLVALTLASGCMQTWVRPVARTSQRELSPPARILVLDFAISEKEITEYQGIMRQQPNQRDPVKRQLELGRNVAETLTRQLSNGLQGLGLNVERAPRGIPTRDGDLIVDGKFISVDEGSPLRRLVIGFGSGAAKLETRFQILRGRQQQKLLEFDTKSDSGMMPGAVATTPAGAVAPPAMSVALTAGGAVNAGLNVHSSPVERMAVSNADQAVRYLSEFFASHGWIDAHQVKKARLAYQE
jgi:hypothetical protein